MIGSLESYLRSHWDDFNFPFALPTKLTFLFLKGFRKTIFFLFKDNDSQPFAVLKIGNDPLAFERLQREFETLSYFSAKEIARSDIPTPLAFFEMSGHTCVLETALGGTPMVYYMKGIRTRRGLIKMREIFSRIVDILVTFDKPNRHYKADSKHQNVVEHGDFNPSNLYISRSSIKIFDWEYSSLQGLPLKDLLDFSLKYVLFARYLTQEISREHPVLNDFEEAFLSETKYSGIIWKNISAYCKKMEIHKSSIQDIMGVFAKKYLNDSDADGFLKKLNICMMPSSIIAR